MRVRPLRTLAVALAVAGCGGASPEPVPTSPEPPPATASSAPAPTRPEADIDGDGLADSATVEGEEASPVLVVRLGSGGSASRHLDPSPVFPEVVSITGVDGGSVVVVRVGRGASTDLYGLYTWEAGLVPVTLPGGAEAVFPVGASATHVSGLSCDGALEVLSGESTDGETFTTTDIGYRLDGAALVEVSRRMGTAQLGDPVLAPELAC